MTFFHATRGRLTAVALLGAIACGGGDDGADEEFPTRDWSGPYAIEVIAATTDCQGAEAPPPLGDLVLDVRQSVDNDVRVTIGPLVALTGRLEGDELLAGGEIFQPISLPDSLTARVSVADSLETIVYRLEAAFAGDSFRGRYVIRAPDLVALARGSNARRCAYDYELRGVPLLDATSREARPGAAAPGGPR